MGHIGNTNGRFARWPSICIPHHCLDATFLRPELFFRNRKNSCTSLENDAAAGNSIKILFYAKTTAHVDERRHCPVGFDSYNLLVGLHRFG